MDHLRRLNKEAMRLNANAPPSSDPTPAMAALSLAWGAGTLTGFAASGFGAAGCFA